MQKDDDYLRELLSQVSMESLLVIDKRGSLRRIYCPFKARSRVQFPCIQKGEIVVVEELAVTTSLKDVFIIGHRPYYSIYFAVLVE